MYIFRFNALGNLLLKIILIIFIVIIGTIYQKNEFSPLFHHTITPAKNDYINAQKTNSFNEYKSQLIPSATTSVHASTMARLPNGEMMTAWFGGTREGASDVSIYASICSPRDNQWSEPFLLVDRAHLQKDVARSIRKLGNPLLYVQDGRLHLFVVSVSYGGWSASSINHAWSDDSGKTWSTFHRLQLSPLLNISSLVRCAPIALSEGAIGIPVYHELINKYGEWLVLDKNGQILDKTRIPSDCNALQPAIISLNQNEALAFMRNGDSYAGGKISVAKTEDGGVSWDQSADLPIHNPNSGISVLRIQDGSLLLAGNSSSGRSILNLWKNAGKLSDKWELVAQLENTRENEFSYPCLLQDENGDVHLSYTWKRKQIKHVVFHAMRHRIKTESVANNLKTKSL